MGADVSRARAVCDRVGMGARRAARRGDCQRPFNTLNTIAVLFGLALTYPGIPTTWRGWGVFVLLNLVPPLFAGGVLSMGRLTSTLFPLFLALATIIPSPRRTRLVGRVRCRTGLCAALFFTWRELF